MKGQQPFFKKRVGEAGKKCEQELQSVWVCKAVDFLLFLRPKRRCLSKTSPPSHVHEEKPCGKKV